MSEAVQVRIDWMERDVLRHTYADLSRVPCVGETVATVDGAWRVDEVHHFEGSTPAGAIKCTLLEVLP